MNTILETVYTTNTQAFGKAGMKSETVNLRLTPDQKSVIDYAAKRSGISRTEFMVMAAVERAMDDRFDQLRFTLPKDDFNYLMDQLSQDIGEDQLRAVEKMRSVKLPWEK